MSNWYYSAVLVLILLGIVVVEQKWIRGEQPRFTIDQSFRDRLPQSGFPPELQTELAKLGDQEIVGKPALIEHLKRNIGQKATKETIDAVAAQTISYEPDSPIGVWMAMMGFLTLFILVAGKGVTGRFAGVLIDERNRFSLSRLQMVMWTILILSAYIVAVLINIHRGQENPTHIGLDETLWALMGIATTSLVGSPLIKSTKSGTSTDLVTSPPQDQQVRRFELLKQRGVPTEGLEVDGQLIANKDPKDASWADLFRGDDVATAFSLDLSKVQMFYFTIITLLVYGAALSSLFESNAVGIKEFPDLSGGMIALLGISHAGYLTSKAIKRDPTP